MTAREKGQEEAAGSHALPRAGGPSAGSPPSQQKAEGRRVGSWGWGRC